MVFVEDFAGSLSVKDTQALVDKKWSEMALLQLEYEAKAAALIEMDRMLLRRLAIKAGLRVGYDYIISFTDGDAKYRYDGIVESGESWRGSSRAKLRFTEYTKKKKPRKQDRHLDGWVLDHFREASPGEWL